MSRTSERVRSELRAETGVDFSRYRDDELIDALTGWSGLIGIASAALMALGAGLAVAVLVAVTGLVASQDLEGRIGMVVAGAVAGTGVAALTFAARARARVPAEADRVFDLAGAMVDRVAEDVATGRVSLTAAQAARGLAIVAAAPALGRVTRRRFPLVGLAIAPLTGSILTRVLARVWPESEGGDPLTGLDGTARRLDRAINSTRSAVVPKLARAVRWATLPLIVAGVVLLLLAVVIALLALATA